MDAFENKRRHPRAPTRCMIRYRDPAERDVRKSELSTARDLSEGGVRFTSGKKFEVGDIIDLEISCPNFPDPVHAQGEIQWNRELRKGFLYENGVQFLDLSPEGQETIHEIIALILKKSS